MVSARPTLEDKAALVRQHLAGGVWWLERLVVTVYTQVRYTGVVVVLDAVLENSVEA